MPAEWEPHSAVWLAWPYDKITFGSLNEKANKLNPYRLKRVEKEFLKIINVLKDSETVNLIVKDKKLYSNILKNVRMFEANYADVWTRDYMPSFIKNFNGNVIAVKWEYNAYGEKFKTLTKDNKVWDRVNTKIKLQTLYPKISLENGAIDVNGQGIALATEECLLKRNSKLTKKAYEKILSKFLGIKKIIWLKKGQVNDHTDGHVDEIARFVSPKKIVCAYESSQAGANYEILDRNYKVLKKATNLNGKNFEVIKLPMPHLIYKNGQQAPASYCNFYIGNKVVLAPVFKDPNDKKALRIIKSCFPDRKVVPIDCSEIIYGGGAVHCMTQQQPVAEDKN